LLQVAQGPESSLRFFEDTNPTEAVGFFANRNHFAALIYCMMMLTVGWIVYEVAAVQSQRSGLQGSARFDIPSILALIGSITALVILFAGEFMARSRAGLGLTMLALLAIAALGYTSRLAGFGASLNKLLFAAVALVLIFSLQFSLYRVFERVPDTLRDDRPVIARTTIEAAKAYTPFGSGVGTFVPVYAMFERPEDVSDTYVNHAHNDLLELWLEGGVFGLALLGIFVIWLARRSTQIWRTAPLGANDLDWSIARGATIIPTLLLIHSFVDYPLRTGAMMGVMVFACALLIKPQFAPKARESDELQRLREQLARRKSSVLVPAPAQAHAVPTSALAKPPVATLPSPSPETKSEAPPPHPHQRWGADIEWPKEWSQSARSTQPGGDKKE
jgi:O-antigen ligase